ncbi:MAG: heavy-metal-associated domain-containing protein [Candidatus Electrothrix sp. GM3_4]|nr:heavy-metal-associated domain-containing protein [Candidatus Electrothrix sp. GM3_4]
MNYSYNVIGMSCIGCKTSVENALIQLKEITNVIVDLKHSTVSIEMAVHVELEKLQTVLLDAGLHYNLEVPGIAHNSSHSWQTQNNPPKQKDGGVYYCPMRCEEEKTYPEQIGCPVCGMDLLEQPVLVPNVKYSCSMHPEIIQKEHGACPVCGMDLIPTEPDEGGEKKIYKDLRKKMNVAVAFTLPVFIIAMSDVIPGQPLTRVLEQQTWNWVQFF